MATTKTKRTESEYAAQRKQIRLPELKQVDLIKTDDSFEFVYRNTTYEARLSRESMLEPVTKLSQMSRANKTAEGAPCYQMPSNFTLDCVDSYWFDNKPTGEATESCKTNPSGVCFHVVSLPFLLTSFTCPYSCPRAEGP